MKETAEHYWEQLKRRGADHGAPRAGLMSDLRIGRLDQAEPFTTKDGSTIREVAGRVSLRTENQSLAQATVPAGTSTDAHYHHVSEEIYHFTSGSGRMRLGDREGHVRAGDTIVIAPGDRAQAVGLARRGPGAAVLLRAGLQQRGHDHHRVVLYGDGRADGIRRPTDSPTPDAPCVDLDPPPARALRCLAAQHRDRAARFTPAALAAQSGHHHAGCACGGCRR